MDCQSILTRARKTLFDETSVEYSDDELLAHLNAACATIAQLDPKAYVASSTISMVAGWAQSLPAGASALINISTNVDGSGVIEVDEEDLYAADVDWRLKPQAKDVRHYFADPRDPTHFNVWPPNDGTGSVNATYQAAPPTATVTGDFPLPDSYAEPAYLFIVYHALQREDSRGSDSAAQVFYGQFNAQLGRGQQQTTAVQAGHTGSDNELGVGNSGR
ncbi:MAG TPA: DUF6682 family protein [Nevskiaceae bacterium]|nr:DUF6682 family protein [Nevskiaceae bacterium]